MNRSSSPYGLVECMITLRSWISFALFVLVLAPIGSAVVIMVLLLFGMQPATVFAPGSALKNILASWGVHAPNAVGVLSTVAAWWILFAALGIAWELRPKRKPRAAE